MRHNQAPDSSAFYRRMQESDARWTAALKSVQERIRKGERLGVEIRVGDVCADFNLTSGWNAFISNYDYSQPVTPCRVAAAREEWRRQELIRWVLDHPQEAVERLQAGRSKPVRVRPPRKLKEAVKAPETAKEAEPVTEQAPAPVADPQVEALVEKQVEEALAEVRLMTWGFTDLMRGMFLRWEVRDPKTKRAQYFSSMHSLRPQVYDTALVRMPSNGAYNEVREYRGGSFRSGRLTDTEMERILGEGVAQVRAKYPQARLQAQDSLARSWAQMWSKS